MTDIEYTTNLQMPLLIPNQSGKEITHNEALVILDNLVQNCVLDKDLSTPPTLLNIGDVYIVNNEATSDWLGKENNIAIYDNGWRFIEPREGFLFFVKDEICFYIYQNNEWKKLNSLSNLQDLGNILINNLTTNDIIQYNGTNFVNTNELNINKILLNDKSKLELDSSNNFSLKVSNDNINWNESFNINKTNGNIDFKQTVSFNGNALDSLIGNNITEEDLNLKANLDLSNLSNTGIDKTPYRKVNEINITSGTTEVILNLDNTKHNKIIFENLAFSTNSEFLNFQYGINGVFQEDLNYKTSFYYILSSTAVLGSNGNNSANRNKIYLGGNAGTFETNIEIDIGIKNNTGILSRTFLNRIFFQSSVYYTFASNNNCVYLGNYNFNQIKLFPETGTLKSGTIKIYEVL